jgi:hypothetical protein
VLLDPIPSIQCLETLMNAVGGHLDEVAQ